MKKCEYCQSEINEQAIVCPVCKRNLTNYDNDKSNLINPYNKNVSGSIVIIILMLGLISFFIVDRDIEKNQYEYGGYSAYSELSFKSIIVAKSNNLSNAKSLYEDKTFIFQGKIKYIGESHFEIEYQYKGIGYIFDIYWMDSQKSKINKLKKGDNVKFYAIVDDLNPWFGYCTLDKAIII